MNDKRRLTVSKYLSKHLRHSPVEIGLTLEPGGWVSIADVLLAAAKHRFRLTREELDEVVAKCDKQRFALDDTGTKIRANQGHSTEVDLQLEAAVPPAELFHGTGVQNESVIRDQGLAKMSRHHVHLSLEVETARKVGARHGTPIVFAVNSARMHHDGLVFFRSQNGVWLTDHVPPAYLRVFGEPET